MPILLRTIPAFLLLTVAACKDKPTPAAVTLPPTRPFLEIQPRAARLLTLIAEEKKFGDNWHVRLEVVWRPDPVIEVQVDKKPPSPDDFTIEADGVRCVMANPQKAYLKGAYVEVVYVEGGFRFDVSFPNRDERDAREAAQWLLSEKAKRPPEKGKE